MPVSAKSKLAPTVFMPQGSPDLPPLPSDAEVPGSPAVRDDAPEPELDADLITGVSLTFQVLPLGGARAARGFEPFAARVERMGLEPTTPCLQSRCSPS